MMTYDKKKETMRKIIVSQADTIKQLKKEIKSLTDENHRLKTNYEKMNKTTLNSKSIIEKMDYCNKEYERLNDEIQSLKRKLINRSKKIRQGKTT